MSEKKRIRLAPANPECPFCGNYNTRETARTKIYDVCHNSCTWAMYLCLSCDRTFRLIV